MRKIWVIDWKSSKAFYDEMSMQLAAYLSAAHEMDLIDAKERCGIGILRLDKETGMPHFHNCSDNFLKDADRFCALAHYFNLSNEYKEPKRKGKFDSTRWYDIEGKHYPSVTTILGCLDKPALKQWAANCAIDAIESFISQCGFDPLYNEYELPRDKFNEVLKEARTAYAKHSKTATDTGTLVHDAIEAYLNKTGKHDEILANNDQAQNSFLAFLTWAEKVQLEPLHLEAVLHSHEHRYAGRVDYIGYANIEEEEDNG